MKKKWLIVGIVAIAVIGILVAFFVPRGETSEVETAGTIQVPGGPKIKVVCVDFPEELKIEWEELGMDGFQVVLKGTLKNVSSQTVSFDRINFLLDGDWIGKWPPLGGLTLEPNKETKIRGGGIYSSESSKNQILEVKIVGFKKAGDSAPTTSPTIPPEQNVNIFTEAPSNPQSPTEIVLAFAFLCDEKKYTEAEKLMTERALKEYGTKEFWDYVSKGALLASVEVLYTNTYEERGEADVKVVFHFSDKSTFESRPSLIKEDGEWKIDQ